MGLLIGALGLFFAAVLFPQRAPNVPPLAPQTQMASAKPSETEETEPVKSLPQVQNAPVLAAPDPVEPTHSDVTPPDETLAMQSDQPDVQLSLDPAVNTSLPEDGAVAIAADAPVFAPPQPVVPNTPAQDPALMVQSDPAVPSLQGENTTESVQSQAQDAPAIALAPTLPEQQPIIDSAQAPSFSAPDAAVATDNTTVVPSTPAIELNEVVADADAAALASTPVESAQTQLNGAEFEQIDIAAIDGQRPEAPPTDDPAPLQDFSGGAPETPGLTSQLDAPDALGANERAGDAVTSTDAGTPTLSAPSLPVLGTDDQPLNTDVAQSALPSGDSTGVLPVKSEPPRVRSLLGNETGQALPTSASGVKINRIGSAAVGEPEPEEEPAPDQPVGALFEYSAKFENGLDLPLVGFALRADGAVLGLLDTFKELSSAVTIVIDAARSDANTLMTGARDKGFEVALTVDLPNGATASDAAIALEAALQNVPEAVAYVDASGAGQGNAEVLAQLALGMSENGQGLVIRSAGLNSSVPQAQALGVPVRTIKRDLNTALQDERVLSRFLTQAAFQARQDGNVILLGELSQVTLTAIANFQSTPRGRQVAFAPVSAVLKAD